MPTRCIAASGLHALVLAAVLDSCWLVRRTLWRAEAEAVFFVCPSGVYAVSEAFALSLSAVPNYGVTHRAMTDQQWYWVTYAGDALQ